MKTTSSDLREIDGRFVERARLRRKYGVAAVFSLGAQVHSDKTLRELDLSEIDGPLDFQLS